MLLNLTLVGDRQLLLNMERLPPVVAQALADKLDAVILPTLQTHVVRDKLHGQVLHQRSGQLARSIQMRKAELTGTAVMGWVYSAGDVKYAGIHEFGGKTAPHDIYPTKADALHFVVGGREVFAKVVHHPGSQMPERSFLRSSLHDLEPWAGAQLKETALAAARGGLHL
jgi:phage gpG-like protein